MNRPRLGSARQRFLALALVLLALVARGSAVAGQLSRYAVTGMVLEVDPSHRSFVVSHDSVPGLMAAMTMRFDVRDPGELEGVVAGTAVTFTLVVDSASSHAERVQIRKYESAEQDPLTARRLKLLTDLTPGEASASELTIGQVVPDFSLTNQANQRVTFSDLRGKVVAVNFIYTSCALPQFCYRTASQFGVLQRRFKDRLSRDLVLLTVTFDPERDSPEVLAEYARRFLKADAKAWHFLTGAVPDVKRVCDLFGVDFFQDEGLMNHSLHTAVIDRQGTLVANIEGNRFTATHLVDLVDTVLKR